jgi:SAM-dependent methyltransferase
MRIGSATATRRLNWGCGGIPSPGWINSDRKRAPGVDLCCDIREGLPLDDDTIDYAVSIHALPELSLDQLVPALRELRRVLRRGGVLRLGLPDLERGFRAYADGERDYFLVPDGDVRSLGGKLVTQLLWYGYSRSLFTADFIEELLREAGFREVVHCGFRETSSPIDDIVELDDRERESLFVEAVK